MVDRARARLPRMILPAIEHPGAIDETVVHDPQGRPWLISTTDLLYGHDDPGWESMVEVSEEPPPNGPYGPHALESTDGTGPRYETQVFYTARAGIRGFPTGWGERFRQRQAAVAGHRQWCLRVRMGEVYPDLVPVEALW